ncbi:F-box only protein 34 isoform X2 [Thalassophryne amazonica]|uniref:F-box only protein 34 isoform X2 n=1 Tax=Thalassophryne amazonica TaxID=390379 RepID=UPI001472111B|nr:F-box only protein 34 isoform X2 [Thalassophryne amazonica]
MHLKSYPKLVRSELRLDSSGVQPSSQRSSIFVGQQGALRRTCSSGHTNITSNRLPFSVLSTNTLRCSNTSDVSSSAAASLWLEASSRTTLHFLPPPPGCENETLSLYQTAAGDGDSPLDIWAVIKPGHVREKIAIFASESGHPGADGGSRDRSQVSYANHPVMSGFSRAMKAKGSWEENSSAKRRRKSGNNQNQIGQQDQIAQLLDAQQHTHKLTKNCSDMVRRSAGSVQSVAEAASSVERQEALKAVSVVEMVAFLEQRVYEQQPKIKPQLSLQRSCTTITLSRAPPPEVREGLEVGLAVGEEPEIVKVSDMVAKLESECLRRRTEGDLSRSNSLRRTVGRVLLATGEPGSAPSQPSSPSSLLLSPAEGQSPSRFEERNLVSCTEKPTPLARPPATPLSLPLDPDHCSAAKAPAETQTDATPSYKSPPTTEEPLPGLLFLSLPPPVTEPHPFCSLHTEPRLLSYTANAQHVTSDLETVLPRPLSPPAQSSGGDTNPDKKRRKIGRMQREKEGGAVSLGVDVVPLRRSPSASQDFLEMRQRLQQLLEPQSYLAVLPHHLLVKIFLLLPTQSLAALKCTCHYFRFIIENYGVRPADSLWVSDPRYRDDPCKQCKKRFGHGDVSLCRWHHKPYCQALPYGPGYWMCCHGAHRDTPGCNVGLHDNRWVPAFHSINVPIYKRSREAEE